KPKAMAAPEAASAALRPQAGPSRPGATRESDQDFEQRPTAESEVPAGAARAASDPAGPLEAIALYDRLLTEYPGYEHNDRVIYQKARAYDELGRTEEAMATMELFARDYQHSMHYDEVQFRRAEFFFTRRKFRDAESAYQAVIGMGASSSYYE